MVIPTDGFPNYQETTVDPGPWLLVGTMAYSILTLILLPILVILGSNYYQRRDRIIADDPDDTDGTDDNKIQQRYNSTKLVTHNDQDDNIEMMYSHNNSYIGKGSDVPTDEYSPKRPQPKTLQEKQLYHLQHHRHHSVRKTTNSLVSGYTNTTNNTAHNLASWSVVSGSSKGKKLTTKARRIKNKLHQYAADEEKFDFSNKNSEYATSVYSMTSKSLPQNNTEIGPMDAADAYDPGKVSSFDEAEMQTQQRLTICCGSQAIWRPAVIYRALNDLVDIAEYDNEFRRLVSLAIPFTISEVSEEIFELISIVLVSHFLGTDALAAATLVGVGLEVSEAFIEGILEAEETICSHAIGQGNKFLAGQYVQLSMILYAILSIPLYGIWLFVVKDILLLLGMTAEVADMGQAFLRIHVITYVIEGVTEAYTSLLDITGYEQFLLAVDIVQGVVETSLYIIVLTYYPGADLVTIAWIDVLTCVVFSLYTFCHVMAAGWLRRFKRGLWGRCAFKNKLAIKTLLKTAFPLSLGNVVSYGEWELLTIFAAVLGEAEVAAWAVLGSIWDIFETSTEGIGDAAAIRIAYHMGKGRAQMAKLSAYKSLLLGFIFALLTTSIFFIIGEDLITWMTVDATLQNFMVELLPLMGIGNITMIIGSQSWNLVGGQGRYNLATMIALVCSWGLTVPLAAFFVFYCNFDLQGIASAVVIGFSTTALWMGYKLFRSDWESLTTIIVELNKVTDMDESSVDDEDDSDGDDIAQVEGQGKSSNVVPTLTEVDEERVVTKSERGGSNEAVNVSL